MIPVPLNFAPNGHLFTTGHSLGGGLSSAAAVAGGIPAHIFNAAGLHRDTLFRDANGNLTPNETYAGSAARYDNAKTINRLPGAPQTPFINSYYVEYDVLNLVQNLSPIPDSIGRHHSLESPHDSEVGGAAILLGIALGAGQGWASVAAGVNGLSTLIEAHGHPSILYGLLVRESAFGIESDALGIDAYFP